MFFVIEGIDGSGKTTIAKQLVEKSNGKYLYVNRKSILGGDGFIQNQMEKVSQLMWTENNGELDHLLPVDYWINLQLTWYSLLQEFIIKPNIKKNIIVDGWFYKFWARLETQNIDINYLKSSFQRIIKPDHVVLLTVNVDNIINRKKILKKYEEGSHIGLSGKSGYVRFQNLTENNLEKYAQEYNWKRINNSTNNIKETVNLLYEYIENLIDETNY